jgi:hypothetical protein
MSQYRITSSDFYIPGDTGEPNTVLSPEDPASAPAQAGLAGKIIQQSQQPIIETKH